MLALMEEANDYLKFMAGTIQECLREVRQTQNTINELWAEWTRTHGLRGIPGKGATTNPAPRAPEERAVVRRVLKK